MPTYNPADIAVINSMIENNGLNWTKAEPADGSYIPDDWNSTEAVWAHSPKRITALNVQNKNLHGTLNLTGLSALRSVNCSDNQLTGLNVQGIDGLDAIWCTNNQLTELNVSGLGELKRLYCENNKLTELDVRGLAKLTRLYCSNNQLTALYVSEHPYELEDFYCDNNKLIGMKFTPHKIHPAAFNSDGQTPALVMVWNSEKLRYESAIKLNLPRNLSNGIGSVGDYEESILTATYETPDSTTFSVRFLYSDDYYIYYYLHGKAGLTYEGAPVYHPSDVVALNAIINAHSAQSGAEWAVANAVDGSVAPTAPAGKIIWDNHSPKRITGLDVSGTGLQGTLDLTSLHRLKNLDCSNNALHTVILYGLSLSTFNGSGQNLALTLAWNNVTSQYEKTVALNKPAGLSSGIGYSGGKLTALDKSQASTSFTVETGNTGNTLSGIISLTYANANAEMPSINGQPQSLTVSEGATANLSVTASVSDGGTLTYQWYSHTINSNIGGTAISGATDVNYSPATSAAGTFYYYAVVTNTNTGVSGAQTAMATSLPATVTVDAIVEPDRDSTLYGVTVNGRTLIVSEAMQYSMSCGEDNITMDVLAPSKAQIFVNGEARGRISDIPITGELTVVNIVIVAESGARSKEYRMTIAASLSGDKLYISRWNEVHNPQNNGGRTITGVRWYHNDEPAGTGRYIEITAPASEYRAEIEINGVWYKLCPYAGPKSAGIVAYPNPVSRGESLTLQLPEGFIGGTLSVYTTAGTLVKTGITLPTELSNVRVDELASGIYLFRVNSINGNSETVKVIVE